jgi:pyruvate dehydrogenase E2 component (dihydrolipoamide acetyltransferase)
MAKTFKLPDIGEGVHEGEIVQWHVKPGDTIQEDQPMVEVMTDKVTAEIPAPFSGTVKALNAQPGEVVKVGSVIIEFEEDGAAAAVAKSTETVKAEPARPVAEQPQAIVPPQPALAPSAERVLAAPATRKLARELGVNLTEVPGSGPSGRVTPDDVRRASEAPTTHALEPVVSRQLQTVQVPPAETKRVPFTGIRRKIAEHLTHAKRTAPHFAYVEEADFTEVVAMRQTLLPFAEGQDIKLTYLPFVIKAVLMGLKAYPVLNSQLDEAAQELVYQGHYNIGVAVATENGLVVPVVKNADQKSLFQLSKEIQQLADKARAGRLTLDEMRGGTFTLTSIGSIGGLFGVPIINVPEVAILGVNKISRRPVVRQVNGEEAIVIRDMMYLSIVCDHRVVDGAEAALFLKKVIQILETPALLIAGEDA